MEVHPEGKGFDGFVCQAICPLYRWQSKVVGADFVFAEDYQLRPLSEVKAFIQENKHLPEIKSAREMQESGIGVSELQTQLLQKIEELTLYLIQQEQTIQELQQEVEQLKK